MTRPRFVPLALVVLSACAEAPSSAPAPPVGTSTAELTAATMSTPRASAAMSLLTDGTVLITGGYTDLSGMPSALADEYDPETGRVQAVGPMQHSRARHTSTVLRNGLVLIVGGGDASAELYDPYLKQFSLTGSMGASRIDHTATLLPDGTVMVVGGSSDATTELYKPLTKKWAASTTLTVVRSGHTATLVNTDPVRLVISGGKGDTSVAKYDFRVTDLYDTVSNTWSSSASRLPTNSPTGGQESASIALLDGRMLMTEVGAGTLTAVTLGQPNSWVFVNGEWVDHGGCSKLTVGTQTLRLPDGEVYSFGGFDPVGGTGCYGLQPSPVLIHWVMQAGIVCTAMPTFSTEVLRREGNGAVLPNGSVLLAGGLDVSDGCNWAMQKSMSVLRLGAATAIGGGALAGIGRIGAAASTLPSGDVLVSGGTGGSTGVFATAEFYSGNVSNKTLALSVGRAHHTSTVLLDGRVLLAGGVDSSGTPLADAELYDLTTQTGVLIPLQHARAYHTASLLYDGRVLLVGGLTDGGTSSTSELFSPTTLKTASAGDLAAPRAHHAAAILRDGRVVVTGGQLGSSVLASAETFSVGAAWSGVSGMSIARTDFTLTEVGGKLIAVGGIDGFGNTLKSTDLFNADTQMWVPGPTLAAPRSGHTATVLTSGLLVVAGGFTPMVLDSTELYDVQTGKFAAGPMMKYPAGGQASARSKDGVLLFGGPNGPTNVNFISDGQTVLPSLKPIITAVPGAVAPGETFFVSGSGFAGAGENGGGSRRSVSTNQPVFFISRFDGEGRRFFSASEWTGSDVQVTLPVDVLGGLYWLRVGVGGASSDPVVLRIGTGDGQVCSQPTECVGGFCVANICCSSPDCGPVDGGMASDAGMTRDAGSAGDAGQGDGGQTSVDGGVIDGGGTGSGPGDAGSGGAAARDLYSCGCSESGAPSSLLVWALGGLLLLRRRVSARRVAGVLMLPLLVMPMTARAAAPEKVAVGELKGGSGVSKELPDVVADQLIVELQQRGFEVTSSKDIAAQLGHDRERQLLGCSSDTSCLAEVGAALDVAFIVTGSIAKVGNSLALSINAVNTHKSSATRHYATRIKPATEEAVLDLLPTIVSQLFPDSRRVEKVAEAPPTPVPPPLEAKIEPSAPPPLVTTLPPVVETKVRHFAAWVRGQLSPFGVSPGLHGAVMPFVGFRFDERWAISAGFIASQPFGVMLRASAVPFFVESRIHPVVALEVPLLFASSPALAVGGAVGAEWVPLDFLCVVLEIPVQYFVVAPAGLTRFWVFGALSVGVRL